MDATTRPWLFVLWILQYYVFWQHHTTFDRVHPYTGTESQLNSFTRYLLLIGSNMCPLTHDDDLLNMFPKCCFMYIYTCVCLVSQCGCNMYLTWSCFNVTVYLCTYITLTNTHAHTYALAQTHTHITHNRTFINASMSVCTYSYTRSLLYISVDCWTYPILYHSPEQLTICIFPVFCCLLFCLFCSISFIKTFCYIQFSNMEEIKILYCIVLYQNWSLF